MFDRHIAFGARLTPDEIAVSNGHDHVAYAELDRIVDRVALLLSQALGDGGHGAEKVIGLAIGDAFRHAVAILACARIGRASASLFPQAAARMATIVGAGVVVTDAVVEEWNGPTIVVDAAWFERRAGERCAVPPRALPDPRGIARIQLSSGSTGMPKAVALDWDTIERRSSFTLLAGRPVERRILSLIGPESGGLQVMLSTWRQRGCVLIASPAPSEAVRMLPILRPTGLLASPVQLAALMDALPEGAVPMAGCDVFVAGGRVSRALVEAVAIRLGARTTIVYASTEAGTTAVGYAASLPADGVGHPTPSSIVAIVDEAGAPLPPGEVGRVRIAGHEIASGYWVDGQIQPFADGHFYPGDLGSLDATGVLRIHGREDEVMNLGGEKFLPDTIEAQVRGVPGIADVAAFTVEDAAGATEAWLAVVRDGAVDEAAVGRALSLPGLPMVRIGWIDAIPRTPLGKVRRDELRKAAATLSRPS